MKKNEKIKQIIEYLITSGKFNNYTKQDIEKSIIITLQPLDERTITNWFTLLWRLEYVIQPQCGTYSLNLSKVQLLEVKLPIEADPKQSRLS
jgi:hypothetical protein